MGSQQEAVGVGHDMALAPMEALAGVESAWPAGLRRRGGLASHARQPSSCRLHHQSRAKDLGEDEDWLWDVANGM